MTLMPCLPTPLFLSFPVFQEQPNILVLFEGFSVRAPAVIFPYQAIFNLAQIANLKMYTYD